MTNSVDHSSQYENETSLVDVAATLIRRWRIFCTAFLVLAGLGVAYAMLATERYEYISLLQVAEKNRDELIEKPAATIATLESRWLPEQQSMYRAENEKPLPFELTFSNPENTNLLRIRTLAAKSDSDLVLEVHTSLIERIKSSQNSRLESEKISLERQLSSLDEVIESLQGQDNAGDAIAGAIERKVELESAAEQLRGVEVLVTSRESAEIKRPERKLIIVLALVIGGMMGVLIVFIAEFWAAVKREIRKTS